MELWGEKTEDARAAFAEPVGAAPADVAAASLSAGVNGLASGCGSTERARRSCFPTSSSRRWDRSGTRRAQRARRAHARLRVRDRRGDAARLAHHVGYRTGERLPVEEITRLAHERGALVFRRVPVRGNDPARRPRSRRRLPRCRHRQVPARLGRARVLLRTARARRGIRPTTTGWFADEDVFATGRPGLLAPTAARFQSGTPPVPSIYAGLAGLRLVLEAGVERLAPASRS